MRGHTHDGLLTSASRTRPLAFDTTLTCPLLPSYLDLAARSPDAPFLDKASRKISKHAQGCIDMGNDFLPFVVTTFGGIGPPSFRAFLRSVHLELATHAIAAGDSTVDANAVYAKFLSTLQAVVARANYMTVHAHTPPFT